MSTFDQLREGLSRAWDTITVGWRELVERAGDALTRFHPPRPGADMEPREERLARSGARWSVLAAEVSVGRDAVEVAIEVPGMEPGDFEIQVAGDALVIRGEKRVERTRTEGDYHVMERAYGAFERAIRLPEPVEESGAKAEYRRGVLRVSLPRTRPQQARRIEVRAG
ncbi:MAG: Hsp20/alpha crystallin family protein [Ectothiorhodospiraceae bacterium]|nr:Hsp20/alpha crystallin family protein [Ectothiorhodospiraceae bacterium]